jgi:hypothetical protein
LFEKRDWPGDVCASAVYSTGLILLGRGFIATDAPLLLPQHDTQ